VMKLLQNASYNGHMSRKMRRELTLQLLIRPRKRRCLCALRYAFWQLIALIYFIKRHPRMKSLVLKFSQRWPWRS
jgi:hypothetical protein